MRLLDSDEILRKAKEESRRLKGLWSRVIFDFESLKNPDGFNSFNQAHVAIKGYKLVPKGFSESEVYIDLRTGEWFGKNEKILEALLKHGDELDPENISALILARREMEKIAQRSDNGFPETSLLMDA